MFFSSISETKNNEIKTFDCMVKDQKPVVDVTSEVRRKFANMKKTEARRIANETQFFSFSRCPLFFPFFQMAAFYCKVCRLNASIQNFKNTYADAGMLIKAHTQQVSR